MANECIYSNPDIAGIGVRVNFYVTIICIALIPENEYTDELLDGIYKSSVIYGLSLIITAIVQTVQEQLDLYHAIVVLQITICLSVVYAYGQKRYFRSNKADFRMKLFVLLQTFTSMVCSGWYLYVWIKDSNFGSQPSCNHLVKYVLFFVDVRVTTTWLRVMFIVSSISSVFFFACVWQILYRMQQFETPPNSATPTERPPSIESPIPQLQTQSIQKSKFWRTVLRYVLEVGAAAYGVATLETIVSRNRSIIQPGENAWGFGQLIAIILTLGIFIDIIVAVREWWTKKRTPPDEHSDSRV
ncbi:hypothetical protein DFH94DRAFT_216614 [Russula ochroleuca]|uniref:Uncharacterized protein n=1 Tax=Russula ochroleuca TaxID=152965 RepID=A0A9P5MP73_9AGAM|nr:hypothetical protein DFH94DRAFT_216614 [Russula ochroleuca]